MEKEADHESIGKFFGRASPMGLSFKDLVFTVASRKRGSAPIELLHTVSGGAPSGTVTAILGPSGAGKTTLLNTLSWRAKTGISGRIEINNIERMSSHKKKIGYVMQKDYFFSTLTVKETLQYTAKLCRGDLSADDTNTFVNHVISMMGLQKCANTKVGDAFARGISGGEMKRLNIGNELISNPSIVFLDEPTSGLDSTSAVSVLAILDGLAKNYGKTVVMSIHQPNSWAYSLLDRVIAVSAGHIVYEGPANLVMPYLKLVGLPVPEGWNVADHLMDLLCDTAMSNVLLKHYKSCVRYDENGCGYMQFSLEQPMLAPLPEMPEQQEESTERDEEAQIKSSDHVDVVVQVDNAEDAAPTPVEEISKTDKQLIDNVAPKEIQRFWILLQRGFKKDVKNTTTILNLVEAILVSLIAGVLWFGMMSKYSEENIKDRIGFLFFALSFWSFLPAFSALSSFPPERVVIAKERGAKMFTVSNYLAAKTVSDVLVYFITPTIWLLIAYPMVGLPADAKQIFALWGTLLLNMFFCHSVGMTVSAIVSGFKEGAVILAVFLLTSMLLSGFLVANIPSWMLWLRWLSFEYYSLSIVLTINMQNVSFECIPDSSEPICPIPGQEIINRTTASIGAGLDALVLIFFFIFSKFLTYLLLRFGKQLKLSS